MIEKKNNLAPWCRSSPLRWPRRRTRRRCTRRAPPPPAAWSSSRRPPPGWSRRRTPRRRGTAARGRGSCAGGPCSAAGRGACPPLPPCLATRGSSAPPSGDEKGKKELLYFFDDSSRGLQNPKSSKASGNTISGQDIHITTIYVKSVTLDEPVNKKIMQN